jgi:hypothetical protein
MFDLLLFLGVGVVAVIFYGMGYTVGRLTKK